MANLKIMNEETFKRFTSVQIDLVHRRNELVTKEQTFLELVDLYEQIFIAKTLKVIP